jgi:hypothetical protein
VSLEGLPGNPADLTPEQRAVVLAAFDASVEPQFVSGERTAARTALTDALALADLYPAPTPEETSLIDSQVAAALDLFIALVSPPADVVSLASAVIAWRTRLSL